MLGLIVALCFVGLFLLAIYAVQEDRRREGRADGGYVSSGGGGGDSGGSCGGFAGGSCGGGDGGGGGSG
jgi:hypothetical protein